MLLNAGINIKTNSKLKILLLIIGIVSFDFWNMAIRVGTKSSLVVLILLLSVFFLAKYVKEQKIKNLIFSSFFSATLIATKITFLSIFLTFNAIIIIYNLRSRVWIKPLIIYNISFFSFISIWHIEILMQPNWFNQLSDNFYLTKQTYDQSIMSYGEEIRQAARFIHYLILKYLPYVIILQFADIKKNIYGLFDNRDHSLVVISLITSLIYLITNILILFPNLATPHYDILFPLFLLIIIFFSRGNISKVKFSSFVFMFTILFCVNFGLAIRKGGGIHYGRFTIIKPSMLKYEYGNNDVVKFLNEKKNEGHEEYLYVGRRNHQIITTELKERSESASGTSAISYGNEYGLNEIISNRLKLIDMSNIKYLLKNNTVVAVQRDRLIMDLNRRVDYNYDDFLIELHNTGYSNHFSNEVYDIYIKNQL